MRSRRPRTVIAAVAAGPPGQYLIIASAPAAC